MQLENVRLLGHQDTLMVRRPAPDRVGRVLVHASLIAGDVDFVFGNGTLVIDRSTVLAEFEYEHPVFDAAAMAAQRRRPEIQGHRGTFFAGAYWGYGFHEDGVVSALDVCRHFGVEL